MKTYILSKIHKSNLILIKTFLIPFFRTLSNDADGFTYVVSFIIQALASFTYVMTLATILSVFVGFSTYLNTLMDDFSAISSRHEKGINENSKLKTKKILNEHIELHYDILT